MGGQGWLGLREWLVSWGRDLQQRATQLCDKPRCVWSPQGGQLPSLDAGFTERKAASISPFKVKSVLVAPVMSARHLPAHLPDTRQLSHATPACSSAWYSPAEPRDTCPLIWMILASWASRLLQEIFPSQWLNPCLLCCRHVLYCWATGEAHCFACFPKELNMYFWPRNPILTSFLKRNKNICLQKDLYMNIYCHFIHTSSKVK